MSDAPEVSLVMPCLDEAATLGLCIRNAQDAIARLALSAEIVVADNGSTDGSAALAASLGARVVPEPRRGYGHACRAGLAAARGRYLIMADADASYDWGEIGRFLVPLREGFELVMGTRLRGRIDPGAMPWLHRYVGNPGLTLVLNLLFRAGVSDAQCGMRALSREALERLSLSAPGMEFASEMVVEAARAGLRLTEIPITLHRDQRSRPGHLRPWRDGWRHLRYMLAWWGRPRRSSSSPIRPSSRF